MFYFKWSFYFVFYLVFSPNSIALANQAPWVGNSFNGYACQGSNQGFGPYDYSNKKHRKKHLPIVENYHFTPEIQQLIRGKTGSVLGDINYTIMAFPNHYKALTALMYYDSIFQSEIIAKKKRAISPPLECYFQRAMNFVSKDATLKMLYAGYLKKKNKIELATQFYEKAIELAPKQLRFRYIYAMFLMDQKQYNPAVEQAKIIYEKHYPDQKLKKALIKLGKWE